MTDIDTARLRALAEKAYHWGGDAQVLAEGTLALLDEVDKERTLRTMAEAYRAEVEGERDALQARIDASLSHLHDFVLVRDILDDLRAILTAPTENGESDVDLAQ